jgi:hypothetical protein
MISMKILLSIFFLQTVFFSTAQSSGTKKLQGLWNSSWTENIPTPGYADAAYYAVYHNSDLYFEGDSMWRLECPCKRIGVETYSIKDFEFLNDSTVIYSDETYSRQKVDINSIEILKKHEFNSECYTGKWNLIRSESGGDGTGVVFIYPFELADTLILANDALDGSVLKLVIEGKEKAFNFRMEKMDFEYILILTPTESWKKEDKVMWTRYWELPPPKKRELRAIKRTEGIDLELRFRRI